MDDQEKGVYQNGHANEVPAYEHGGVANPDVRKGSIVMGEGAEMYGDIETAERELFNTTGSRRLSNTISQSMAMLLEASNLATFNSSHSVVPLVLVCFWVSALPSRTPGRCLSCSATHSPASLSTV